MESIKELRQKLQTGVAGHPYLQRVLSIYITRLLLSTAVTPNQVTVVMLLTGVAGALSLALGYVWLGFFLVYLCILLDASHGGVARYRQRYSLRGVYLDLLNHIAMEGIFFLGLTFWVADISGTPDILVLVIGILGAFALPFTRANGDLPQQLYVHYAGHRKNFTLPPASGNTSPSPQASGNVLHILSRAIYMLRHFAVMVIVLFAVFIAESLLFPQADAHPVLSWAIVGYAALFWLYLAREVVGVFFSVESRVAAIRDALEKGHE